ncbi:MAG: exo-alpha-sialidase [Bryobacterales bacterium]|nr:exo-alpha-sialidase [Bryobacterales bacterium]
MLLKANLLFVTAATMFAAGRPPQPIHFEGRLSMPARLADGTLISLYAEMRPFSEMANDNPTTPVYRRLSRDHGATWSAPQKVFSYAAGKGVFAFQVFPVVDNKGAVHAFAVRYFSLPNKERAMGHSELFHAVSNDMGATWSTPKRADFGHGYTGAINSIIQLRSGRILGALSYTSDNFIESVGQREFRVVSFYSDDNGESWKVGADNMQAPFGPQVVHPGAIEPVMVELEPNKVRMLIRTQTLRFYESLSTDGGATFAKPVASRFMAPDSPGAIIRVKSGDLLLVWNDIQSYPNGVTGNYRQYLYGSVSRDNGKTWSPSKRVGPLDQPDLPKSRGDYPMLCEAADGSVLLYYTRFGLRPAASYVDQHNELVRLHPAWFR